MWTMSSGSGASRITRVKKGGVDELEAERVEGLAGDEGLGREGREIFNF